MIIELLDNISLGIFTITTILYVSIAVYLNIEASKELSEKKLKAIQKRAGIYARISLIALFFVIVL